MQRDRALVLRLSGATYREIAFVLGISRQRVQQLISPPPAIRNAVVEQAHGKCQSCGEGVGISGHVHHQGVNGIDAEDYNDMPNLVLLCVGCHTIAHGLDGAGRDARLSIYLSREQHRAFKALCKARGRSMNPAIRQAVLSYTEQRETELKKEARDAAP